jgi:tetratricopeptide (TPR) repeat protein
MPEAKQHTQQKFIVGGLLLLGGFVFLLLPNMVTEPWIAADDSSTAPVAPAPLVSPSTAAEKTKYRQDSQKVLAQIIAARDSLQERSVEYWGDFDFRQAIALVDQGDEQYGYGNYRESLASYQQSLLELQRLQDKAQITLENALADASNAIENAQPGDVAIAQQAANTAITIAPDDSRSQQILARTSQLEALVEALQLGEQHLQRKELATAKAYFQKALALDGQHKKATAALSSVDQAIVEQTFRGYMSRGFKKLEDNNFDAATAAFNEAGRIYTNHPAVDQALSQLETRRSQLTVSRQMREAAAFERQEDWQKALALYQALLKTDPSLTEASVRTVGVTVRANLDEQLKMALKDPLALSSPNAYNRAQRLVTDADSIKNPGPKLQQQVSELKRLLQQSTVAVNVELRSNNLTEVTLFRVAELGTFENTSLQLRPGRYIAAGTRLGFRDVRVEFTISGEPLDQPIWVSCEEAI